MELDRHSIRRTAPDQPAADPFNITDSDRSTEIPQQYRVDALINEIIWADSWPGESMFALHSHCEGADGANGRRSAVEALTDAVRMLGRDDIQDLTTTPARHACRLIKELLPVLLEEKRFPAVVHRLVKLAGNTDVEELLAREDGAALIDALEIFTTYAARRDLSKRLQDQLTLLTMIKIDRALGIIDLGPKDDVIPFVRIADQAVKLAAALTDEDLAPTLSSALESLIVWRRDYVDSSIFPDMEFAGVDRQSELTFESPLAGTPWADQQMDPIDEAEAEAEERGASRELQGYMTDLLSTTVLALRACQPVAGYGDVWRELLESRAELDPDLVRVGLLALVESEPVTSVDEVKQFIDESGESEAAEFIAELVTVRRGEEVLVESLIDRTSPARGWQLHQAWEQCGIIFRDDGQRRRHARSVLETLKREGHPLWSNAANLLGGD